MKSGLVLQENENNGTVFNAKGDVAQLASASAIGFSAVAPNVVSVTLNADGTITKNGNTFTSGDNFWVDTDGSNDTPVNPAAWVGDANYTLTWTAPTGSGGTPSPAGAQVSEVSFPQTFTLADNNGGALATWNVTIHNNNVGASFPTGFVSIDLEANGACFEGNTPVLMADNTQKLIKNIVIGDVLAAYSVPNRIDESVVGWENWEESALTGGFGTTSTVTGVTPRDVSSYYILNNDIKVTPGHVMLIFKQSSSTWQWVLVSDIAIGDLMYDNTGNTVAITSMVTMSDTITVYNIDVENVDTFYVNMNNDLVVVHNASI